MRIALFGDFNGRTDEGMRRLCADLRAGLGRRHEVLALDTQRARRPAAFATLRRFRPDVLHYLTGPTSFSLVTLRAHQLALWKRTPTIATGLKPFLSPLSRRTLRWVRPDVFLAQSRRWVELFQRAGSEIVDFPNWIQADKFRLATTTDPVALRRKHGLPLDRRLVLHVGHVKPSRNLECLIPAQQSGRFQTVVIGSQSLSEGGAYQAEMERAGLLLKIGYVPDIQEIYQACDFYAFTAKAMPLGRFPVDRNSIGVIDFPLTILESLACGLRVVSTRHDGAEHFLGQPPGLRFFDGTGSDCLRALDELAAQPQVDTRTLALAYNLDRALDHLDEIYQRLVDGRHR